MGKRTPIQPPPIPGGLEFKGLDFSGVVLRIFPLRANMVRLERFVDDYLNMDLPPEVAHFEPLMPYVFFMVLNYGQMSPVASNLGWVAQHEVAFSVMVQGSWHEGERKVRAPASVSPFIFVDSNQSIVSGREIYGWPKYPATLTPEVDPWLQDPRQPRRLMNLKTPMFRELYSGAELEPLTLLELEQQEPHLFAQVPPGMDYLLSPLSQLPNAFFGGLAAGPDLLGSLLRTAAGVGVEPLAGMLDDLSNQLLEPGGTSSVNTINLKQFRLGDPDPGTVDTAAYQALVNARMVFKKVHGGGLLGSVEVMRGDPTGGFALHVHRNPAFPIVETLGLEIEQTVRSGGGAVDTVRPLTPFWVGADLAYEPARRLCWRTHGSDWSTSERRVPPEPARPARFNTTLGPVVDAVEGPFEFQDVIWRVLPLAASTEKLTNLLPKAETTISGYDFTLEPYFKEGQRSWVYLVVGSYGQMSSAANNLGWWTRRELGIATPFRLKLATLGPLLEELRRKPRSILGLDPHDRNFEKDLRGHNERGLCLLLWPYIFLGSPIAVTEGREMRGVPATFAALHRGRDPWATGGHPDRHRHLLSVDTVDYPAIGVGQGSREQRLLDIHCVPGPHEPIEQAGALADFLAQGLRLPNLALKQFPDEEDPRLACYRALVAYETLLLPPLAPLEQAAGADSPVIGLHSLAGSYEVLFNELPSFPVVERLGLEATRGRLTTTGSPISVCRAHHPFWLRFTQRLSLPLTLWSQSVDGQWQPGWIQGYFESWLDGEAPGLERLGELPVSSLGDLLRMLFPRTND